MVINSRRKGQASLKKALRFYQERGWLVCVVERTGKFLPFKDLFANEEFGGFDFVGVKQNNTLLVQCKTNNPPPLNPYRDFARSYAGPNLHVRSITWYDRKGFVEHEFLSDGSVRRNDYRRL